MLSRRVCWRWSGGVGISTSISPTVDGGPADSDSGEDHRRSEEDEEDDGCVNDSVTDNSHPLLIVKQRGSASTVTTSRTLQPR